MTAFIDKTGVFLQNCTAEELKLNADKGLYAQREHLCGWLFWIDNIPFEIMHKINIEYVVVNTGVSNEIFNLIDVEQTWMNKHGEIL